MADGRHFLNHYISTYQPQIVQIARNLVCRHKLYRSDGKLQKREIPKFNMADGRRIENNFLAITQLHVVPLRLNLEWGDTHTKRVSWKIQNGGCQHLENGYTAVSKPQIVQSWWNILYKDTVRHSRGNMTNIIEPFGVKVVHVRQNQFGENRDWNFEC